MENESLILDLVEWVAEEPRAYDDVMSAWQTSCPRLTIWEDAVDAGFLRVVADATSKRVTVTDEGKTFLRRRGRV